MIKKTGGSSQDNRILKPGADLHAQSHKRVRLPSDSFSHSQVKSTPGMKSRHDLRKMFAPGVKATEQDKTAAPDVKLDEPGIFDTPFRNVEQSGTLADQGFIATPVKSQPRFPTTISAIDGDIATGGFIETGEKKSFGTWMKEKIVQLCEKMTAGTARVLNYAIGEAPTLIKAKELTKQVLALDGKMSKISDSQLQAKTTEFKQRLKKGENLDDILPEAFAAMKEADFRVTGMKPYPEQVLGGVCAHQGRVVEMKTGEGKTLMETLPAYLNALSGNGVHIVTVNDYLAGRDKEDMSKAFDFMGLTTGLIKHGMNPNEQREANEADITYGTNSNFGFQYLRDNMVHDPSEKMGKDLSKVFALVDEVDSILIDEARTPLIISRKSEGEQPPYRLMAEVAHNLKPGEDYEVDQKEHKAFLTEKGLDKAESMLGMGELYSEKNQHLVPTLNNALKAGTLFEKDKHYIVDNGEVKIVDEFTGRVMDGRRYSRGIHQAIEAKEGVEIKGENEVLASISFQNYFKHYGKLAGMTGTGKTGENELDQVYGMGVDVIPTHKPIVRKDLSDAVFPTKKAKLQAVVRDIARKQAKGQPVLVGTRSVEQSEELSKMLVESGVSHAVLNAKYHKSESDIIAQAGRKGAVTIATNMAGRGTDIKLGGDPKKLAGQYVEENGGSRDDALKHFKEVCKAEKQQVLKSGGLAVIGTERHRSRRVDEQLRGRAGRQGDPGESRLYVSLEDELVQWFAGDRAKSLASSLGLKSNESIHNSLVNKAINIAQSKAEEQDLESRKNLLKYDEVMNLQRESIYSARNAIMDEKNLKPYVGDMIKDAIENIVDRVRFGETGKNKEKTMEEIAKKVSFITSCDLTPTIMKAWKQGKLKKVSQKKKFLVDLALKAYDQKEKEIGPQIRDIEKHILLNIVDGNWVGQLTEFTDLREGIGLRGYAQIDPAMAFQKDAYELYQEMQTQVSMEMTRAILSVRYRPTAKVPHPDMANE
ncbi:MAG: preprotein translocase subunit SecA [Candidatus Eremiobacteraeota bacterium]|nr:preprotein translocase subunit SecA [Candidatus Eremiobacteraeota bacterium]